MEKIFNRINYLLLLQKETNGLVIKEEDHDILINIQKDFIDEIIDHKNGFSSNYMSMYS